MRRSKVLQDWVQTDAQRVRDLYGAGAIAHAVRGVTELGELAMLVDSHVRSHDAVVVAGPPLDAGRGSPLPIPSRRRLLGIAAALAVQFGVLLACATRHVALTAVGLVAVGLLLGVAANVDLLEHRIPNQLLTASAIVVLIVSSLSGGEVLADVALGAALAFIPLAVVLLTRGVGMGDVKMAAVLGAAGGLVHPLVGLATVFLMALCSGIVGLTTRRQRLALGPWLWGAFIVASSVASIVLHLQAPAA
jgi:leader peptidase (prepilin peptidase) / N-methyltransferase